MPPQTSVGEFGAVVGAEGAVGRLVGAAAGLLVGGAAGLLVGGAAGLLVGGAETGADVPGDGAGAGVPMGVG
jgi:hypothetical protein